MKNVVIVAPKNLLTKDDIKQIKKLKERMLKLFMEII